MTEKSLPPATRPPEWDMPRPPLSDEDQGTADVVKDRAADLGHGAVQAGQQAADAAREQASNVTAEARRQGKDLIRQAQGQLMEQAARQQQRLAEELRGMSDELSAMASGPDRSGVAADLADQAAGTTRNVAQWLDEREPGQLLQEVKTFARQRPGIFLAVAAGAGLLAGRLTRGLVAEAHDQAAPSSAAGISQSRPGSGDDQQIAAGNAGYPASASSAAGTDAGGVPVSATELPPLSPAPSAREEAAAGGAGYERPTGDEAWMEGTR